MYEKWKLNVDSICCLVNDSAEQSSSFINYIAYGWLALCVSNAEKHLSECSKTVCLPFNENAHIVIKWYTRYLKDLLVVLTMNYFIPSIGFKFDSE